MRGFEASAAKTRRAPVGQAFDTQHIHVPVAVREGPGLQAALRGLSVRDRVAVPMIHRLPDAACRP